MSARDGNNEIYVMNADGSGVTRLTDNPAVDEDPAWSPDGSRIVFSSNRDGNDEIYVMNADGSGVTRLTTDPQRDRRPAWCGTRIAFQNGYPFSDVYVMNDDGTGVTRLTISNSSSDESPTWSPSCDRIAYSYDPVGSAAAIHVINADGSNKHGLVTGPGHNRYPAWSPDGARIAFSTDRDDVGNNEEIYVMNADATQQTRVTANSGDHRYMLPVWSHDGTQIAFQANFIASPGTYVMNADGSGLTRLADGVFYNRPAWSPSAAPPPPTGWPNEPAGFSATIEAPFNALDENGWWSAQDQTTNGSGLSLAVDSTAPRSPVSVLQFTYAAGFQGGSLPGIEYYGPPAPVRETYFAFWWKPSNPWQNHPGNVNAIADLFPATSGPIYIVFKGSAQTLNVMPEFDSDTRDLAPNVTATSVTLGAWHLIEWYVKYSSTATSRDGITRWWVDGVLQGDYRDLQMPADAGFVEYDIAPTWGGTGGTKTETDFFWFDHARISAP